jgi:hypothetical protein
MSKPITKFQSEKPAAWPLHPAWYLASSNLVSGKKEEEGSIHYVLVILKTLLRAGTKNTSTKF